MFGSASYWPWLALYTELRGEFHEGWIPNDYMVYKILPNFNKSDVSWIGKPKSFACRLFGDRVVRPVLIFINRIIYDSEFREINLEQANDILGSQKDEVVVKADTGFAGRKVYFLNPGEVNLESLMNKSDYVVQPVVRQHARLDEVYPGSVNTLRVVTYIDGMSHVHVLCVKLKVGANGTRVDNNEPFGRFMYIDPDGRVITDTYIASTLETEVKHPNTGFVYKDLQVPSVSEAMALCREAHSRYPYVGIVGWDVYIDKKGAPGIIEWNTLYPGMWLHEAFIGPLFDIRKLKQKMDQADITI